MLMLRRRAVSVLSAVLQLQHSACSKLQLPTTEFFAFWVQWMMHHKSVREALALDAAAKNTWAVGMLELAVTPSVLSSLLRVSVTGFAAPRTVLELMPQRVLVQQLTHWHFDQNRHKQQLHGRLPAK
jgi:hypothetical protein